MTGRDVLAGLAVLATLACGGGGSDSGLPTGNGGGDITVRNNSFNPPSFSVAPNSTVTWTWSSEGVQHNVTFDDGQHSETQGSGQYQRTFATAGSYPYHCTIHGVNMSGTITVAASGTQSGGGSGGGGGGGGGGYGS